MNVKDMFFFLSSPRLEIMSTDRSAFCKKIFLSETFYAHLALLKFTILLVFNQKWQLMIVSRTSYFCLLTNRNSRNKVFRRLCYNSRGDLKDWIHKSNEDLYLIWKESDIKFDLNDLSESRDSIES
jgi:hypothetical protein